MYKLYNKIFRAIVLWDKYSGGSYSRSETDVYTKHIIRNISSKPTHCHFQVTTGFRESNRSRKWFIHSKLHAFISKDRSEIVFWAEPNVNDEDVQEKVLVTCDNILKAWKKDGLLVANDPGTAKLIDEWEKDTNGIHYCFGSDEK